MGFLQPIRIPAFFFKRKLGKFGIGTSIALLGGHGKNKHKIEEIPEAESGREQQRSSPLIDTKKGRSIERPFFVGGDRLGRA